MEKLINLGLIRKQSLLPHLPNIEPVQVDLIQDGCPIHMAVYKIREGDGVLFWVDFGVDRKNGKLVFLGRDGKEELSFGTVGHLYGWPERVGLEAGKEWRQEMIKHRLPVTIATSEACKRLGVTRLYKFHGDCLDYGEVPGVTVECDFSKALHLMTEYGEAKFFFGGGRPQPAYHFLVPPVEAG